MKRAQLIEWGIIVIALIFGYKFFEAIITLFIQLIYGFDGRLIVPDVLTALLAIGLYVVASKNISELLIRKSEADELVFDSKTEN